MCVCVCVCASGWLLLLLALFYHLKSPKSHSLHSPYKQSPVQKEKMKSGKHKVLFRGKCLRHCVIISLSSLLPPSVCAAFLCTKDKMLTPQWRCGERRRASGEKNFRESLEKDERRRRRRGGKKVSVGVVVMRWSFNDPYGENRPLLQLLLRGYRQTKRKEGRCYHTCASPLTHHHNLSRTF